MTSISCEEPLEGIRSVGWSALNFEERTRVRTAALLTTVQGQHRGRRGVATSGRRRWTEEEGARAVTGLKNVRGSAPPPFSPSCKASTVEGGTTQNHADGDGRRRKAHTLFPDYERNACLVPTLTRARLGGCYSDRGAEEEVRIGK